MKSSRGCRWEPSDNTVPMTKHEKSSAFLSVFFLLFGMTFAGGPLSILLLDPSSLDDAVPVLIMIGVFGLIGLGVAWLGVYSIFFRAKTVIDGSTVLYEETGLTRKKWREPLSDYHGVLKHSHYVSGSKNSSGYMVYEVSLVHGRDKDRNILLHESRSSNDLDDRWQHFSRILQLPGLEESVAGYEIHHFGEIRSQSVRPPESTTDYVTELPRKVGGFRVENHQAGKRLSYYRGPSAPQALAGIFFGALFGGLPLWIYLTEDPTPFLFIFIGVGGLLVLGSILWSIALLISTEVLEIEPGIVRHYVRYPWGPAWFKEIRQDQIRRINLSKNIRSSNQTIELQIESPGTSIKVDGKLSDEEKDLLRDYLSTRLGLLEADTRAEAV